MFVNITVSFVIVCLYMFIYVCIYLYLVINIKPINKQTNKQKNTRPTKRLF